MSLTSKIAGLAVALVVATTVAFGLLVQRAAEQAITAREGDRLIYGVSGVAQKLHDDIEKAINDVKVAASTSAVKGLARAIENGGIDPVDRISTGKWQSRLGEHFKQILASEPSYLAIDLIGVADGGRELVEAERTEDGEIRIESGELRQHGNTVFFANAIKQPVGAPYISDITQTRNRNGRAPLVIDVATPVTMPDGRKFGILKLTIDCSRLIAHLMSFNDAVSKLYVTTLNGTYIINPDVRGPAAAWSGGNRRIQDDFPWLAAAFKSRAPAEATAAAPRQAEAPGLPAPAGSSSAQATDPMPAATVYPEGKSYKGSDHLARTLCVSVGTGAAKRTWVILGVINTHALIDSALRFKRYLAGIVLVLILLSVLAAYVLARRITRPISRLTEAAKRVAEGRLDAGVRIEKSDDETVAELGKAFIAMQDAVKNRERRLREARARIEAIVDSTASAIITVDPHGKIIQANHATAPLFGYEPCALEGQSLSMLVHDSYVESLFDTNATGEVIGKPREIIATRADGKTFPAEIAVSKVQISGAGSSFVVMLTDLSERKRFEDLENQLKLERIKTEFIATVSHELRTPLTSINGSLALLRSESLGLIPPNARPLINIAYSNSERLMRLINDILDLEKIKSGTLSFDFEELDVGVLLYEAARANAAYAEQLDVTIKVARVPQGILIMGDSDRMAQALANLISNAAKFSPKGATVVLAAKKKNGWVRICVTDKGEGIPDNFRDRIFSRFAQADSTDARKKGGSGLGLSITKAIVEAHGGKIGFTTAPGKGTTFFIDVPLAASVGAVAERPRSAASG